MDRVGDDLEAAIARLGDRREEIGDVVAGRCGNGEAVIDAPEGLQPAPGAGEPDADSALADTN